MRSRGSRADASREIRQVGYLSRWTMSWHPREVAIGGMTGMVGAILGVGSVVGLRSDLGWASGSSPAGPSGDWGAGWPRGECCARRRPAWSPWEMTVTAPKKGDTGQMGAGRYRCWDRKPSTPGWLIFTGSSSTSSRSGPSTPASAAGAATAGRDDRAGRSQRILGAVGAGSGRDGAVTTDPPGPVPTGRGAH